MTSSSWSSPPFRAISPWFYRQRQQKEPPELYPFADGAYGPVGQPVHCKTSCTQGWWSRGGAGGGGGGGQRPPMYTLGGPCPSKMTDGIYQSETRWQKKKYLAYSSEMAIATIYTQGQVENAETETEVRKRKYGNGNKEVRRKSRL